MTVLERSHHRPRLASVGTAVPPHAYSQQDVLTWSSETDPKIRRLFRNSHIESRRLYLPELVDGEPPEESNQELIDKHLRGALEIGPKAIEAALSPLGLAAKDIGALVCITSTGFLCPGISARLSKHMALRDSVVRLDIVGMGCNAAVNGLRAATSLAQSHPDLVTVLVCVEICSAAYVRNRTMSTAVVNSLFGDGAAALVVRAPHGDDEPGPVAVDFEPLIVTDAIEAMRYELEGTKLSFFLERNIPFVIGEHVSRPVGRLLARHGLEVSSIDHWLLHGGGKKVIDAIRRNLGLTEHDLRHARDILRRFGNVSSGSVLFSFAELQREAITRPGDLGLLIAMGPGTSIETTLLAW
ncbi:MAG: type III polyketide synthase [Holophagales bacterium]|nr:type III polyketide synthase [Holophagales bacterium]